MSADEVTLTRDGAVRVLTINRPQRRNAMTGETAEALRKGLEQAGEDAGTGAVVITGAGGHFSAGGDGTAILAAAQHSEAAADRLMRGFHRLIDTLWTADLPVIAAVSGVAYGGGFNLALACDLVYCSADARFCQVFLRRGVIPDVGGAYLLPRLVGMQRAKELMLLTEELDAAAAHRLGVVNAVLPDPAEALAHAAAVAARLAAGPRFAIAQTKKLLNATTSGSLRSALDLEAAIQTTMLRSESVQRSFADFLGSKRTHGS